MIYTKPVLVNTQPKTGKASSICEKELVMAG